MFSLVLGLAAIAAPLYPGVFPGAALATHAAGDTNAHDANESVGEMTVSLLTAEGPGGEASFKVSGMTGGDAPLNGEYKRDKSDPKQREGRSKPYHQVGGQGTLERQDTGWKPKWLLTRDYNQAPAAQRTTSHFACAEVCWINPNALAQEVHPRQRQKSPSPIKK